MPRKVRKAKPFIRVFWEGESEQVYAEFLKKQFEDIAVIKPSKQKGIFEVADALYDKDRNYKEEAEVTDEIWFFFDVEQSDVGKWDSRYQIIKRLRRLKKKNGVRVRLLMTTACIEYWLLLHYKNCAPPIGSPAQKQSILNEVKIREPNYAKGDKDSTWRIACKYPTAVENAEKVLKKLLDQGLPGLDDTDARNQWLYKKCLTFSTVYEAINYLESLKA